jgi:hypothetical protein
MHIRSDGQAEFPYPQPQVFQAAEQAIDNIERMKVVEADGTSGRITVSAEASLWSWGEKLTLAINAEGASTTLVHVTANPKLFTDVTAAPKDREDVQEILEGITHILDNS